MSHVVEPLFTEWHRFSACHRSRLMLAHLRNNRVAWQRKRTSSVTSSEPPSCSSPSSQCRRHSLPTSRDPASRSCDRRHSAPHAAIRLSMGGLTQLAELNECSPSAAQSNGHFQFSAESETDITLSDHQISTPPARLDYIASTNDRRPSLNICSAHARRTVTSGRRSRSLVTPSCHPGNGFASGHLPELTSSLSRDVLPTGLL